MIRWTFRRRRSHETQLDDELQYHVERQYRDYVAGRSLAGGSASARRRGIWAGGTCERRVSRRAPAALARNDRPRRPVRRARPRARAALHAVGDADPHDRHRRHDRHVQRAQRRGAAAAAVFAAARDRGPVDPPHAPEPVRRNVGRELRRLAATEPVVRRHGVVPPHQRQPGRVRRRRRAAASAGRSGRRQLLRPARRASPDRPDVLRGRERARRTGRRAERGTLARAVRRIGRRTDANAVGGRDAAPNRRRHAQVVSAADAGDALVAAARGDAAMAEHAVRS